MLLAALVFLASAAGVYAGGLFDDYLNPVRPGPCTGPANSFAAVSPGRNLGQSFSLPADAGEIYRIGVRPKYESWSPDERVTLTLYESPEKKTKLGSYSIDAATSRVDQYVIGDGSHFRKSEDYVLYFQLRVPTQGRTAFYFELASDGGDEKVEFQAFQSDVYREGQAVGDAADLSFECHIKLATDREGNLRRFFTERLDLSRPELGPVKNAVDAGDWERAIAETVKHFHGRRELWDGWRDVMQVKPDPAADTSLADLILKGQVRHADTGKPIPWRKESWWAPVIPDAKMWNQGINPSPYLWHFDRELAAAYTVTGKPEYARAAIDIRMQWILDNPNPKIIYTGDEFPYYHELWNDRAAAARVPGHADLVYARLYNFDGWTNDEKLVLFSFFEDNARWLYKCNSGGNWGVTAAKSALDFGLAFPEWKISEPCRNWGAARMLEISLEGVRGDGTCVEASIKYHAMIARRLLELLEYQQEGKVKLSGPDQELLNRTLVGMYDHMAHTLQPDGYVVMCGDSWHENYTESPFLSARHISDARSLVRKLKDSADPVSAAIRPRMEQKTLEMLSAWDGASQPGDEIIGALVNDLNALIKSPGLFDTKVIEGLKLRARTRRAVELGAAGEQSAQVNRWLLEDAYPDEITKGFRFGELYKAGKMLKRPDFIWIASQGEEGEKPGTASKLYPEAGYFIMRSDFGGESRYTDARQMFIHNGGWTGSHGHWDLTSLNLYAYGRPLVIDPGQYDYTPPPGIDPYWSSKIHSMLVLYGRDVKREPGPNRWASSRLLDWFDGRHFGYNHISEVNYVRRRVAFVRPQYFLVDDSANTTKLTDWAQVWNLADPNAVFDPQSTGLETTFKRGGNVLILNQDPGTLSVEKAPGITAASDISTTIFRLTRKTSNPRFQTLVYPYDGAVRPGVSWERIVPDDGGLSDLFYSVRVSTPAGTDWAVFGDSLTNAAYRGGKHSSCADFAVVRMDNSGRLKSYAWAYGKSLMFNGTVLAKADSPVYQLAVVYDGATANVEVREPDASIAIAVRGCKRFVLNGKSVPRPIVRDGFYYPFGNSARAVVADDACSFERVTQTNEWTTVPDPGAWSGSYTHHETDPGRRESGDYVLRVPKKGTCLVEVFLPRVTLTPSNRVEYRVPSLGLKPGEQDAAVVDVREEDGATVFVVNQQAMSGWVKLGYFALGSGELRIRAANVTQTDGVYFIADAVRLISSE